MANYKVTESIFNAVKTLLKGGATNLECAEYMKISDSTVSLIKHSETFEEYKQNAYMSSSNYRKKIAAMKAAEAEKQRKEEQKKALEAEIAARSNIQPVQEEKPVKVVHEQSVTIQATHYMTEEMRKTNELLKLISNKLAFIVDELTGTKKEEVENNG